ncbi:DUF1217 domain-containing protein [Indioceanicola profundi]|uniref:DUF1217 domain-containing protein n=1 Tax=Indioceanicola profundi TaxID=2220096 RepID=UPI000E6AC24E|nr:DUF1217 domain-containing protein [Indioceanicola profundi]
MTVLTGIAAFKLADQAGTTGLQRFRDRADIKQEVERFKGALKNVKTLDDFYQNDRVYRFVLESGNLASDIPYRGKVRRILDQNSFDPEALMHKLTDDRFARLAGKLQFHSRGVDRLKLSFVTDEIVNDFVKVRYEQSLGDQNPGVPLARYFRDKIGSVTSEYGVLGDPKLREVMLTALGLPKEIAIQPVESQAEAIKSRVNLSDFKNPQFLEKFLQKYLVYNDQKIAQSSGLGGQDSYLLAMFGRSSNLNFLV